jgi:hypothetical protein
MLPPQVFSQHRLVVQHSITTPAVQCDAELTQLLQRLELDFATNTAAEVYAPHLLKQLENLNVSDYDTPLSSTALYVIAVILSIRACQAAERTTTTIAS